MGQQQSCDAQVAVAEEAVGARYLTIARGLLGQGQVHLPIALVARVDQDRVELAVPAAAAAHAMHDPPLDEPISHGGAPFPAEEQEAIGMSVDERPDFGLGEAGQPSAR